MFSKEIEQVINRYLKYESTKLSIGVVLYNETHIFSYINKSLDKQVKDDFFDIGSLSKVFTSLYVLKLAEEGLINLDDNISKCISLKEGHYWTIKDLLKHRCAFNMHTPIEFAIKSGFRSAYSRKNIYQNIKDEDVIKAANKRGKHINKRTYGYSDYPTALLALLIQSVKNNHCVDELNTFIKDDFNLSNTLCVENNFPKRESYVGNRKIEPWKWDKDNPYILSGGLTSNIKDMTSFLKQLLTQKEKKFVSESFKSDEDDIKHNLVWFVNKKKTSFWHVGDAGTFRSSIILNPSKGIGVVILGNQKGRKNGNTFHLARIIYDSLKRNKITNF